MTQNIHTYKRASNRIERQHTALSPQSVLSLLHIDGLALLLSPDTFTQSRPLPSLSILPLSFSSYTRAAAHTRAQQPHVVGRIHLPRKRREPTPGVPAARHLHRSVVYSVGSHGSGSVQEGKKGDINIVGVG